MPKVNVIIPTFNRAEFIPDAIESVFAQTYKDWELIIVDDGSTDNTKEVIKKYQSNLQYIYQQNKGVSAARNTGIKHAQGELVAFLDSDDIWMPEKLQLQLEIFERYPKVGLVGAGCLYIDRHGNNRGNPQFAPQIITRDDLAIRFVSPGGPSNAVIRKSVLDHIGGFDETLPRCEDWDLWLRISQYYEIRNIIAPLVKFRVHDSYRPNKSFKLIKQCRKRVMEKIQDKEQKRKAYAWSCYHYFDIKLSQGNFMQAFLYLIQSFLFYPFKISNYCNRLQPLLERILPSYIYKPLRSVIRLVRK